MPYSPLSRLSSSASSSSASTPSWPAASRRPSRGPSVRDHDDAALGRSRQGSSASASPRRSCEGMTPAETRGLWQCMLELQQRYGCYNSRRIDLAVNAGDDGGRLMPNPFILDTLNDSVVDLPAEGWQKLDRCLLRTATPSPPEPKTRRRFWRRR